MCPPQQQYFTVDKLHAASRQYPDVIPYTVFTCSGVAVLMRIFISP